MRKLLSSLALSLGMMVGSAQAADVAKLYFGANVSDGQFEFSDEDKMSLSTVHATIGLQLLDFLGVEFEAGAATDQVDSILSDPLIQYQSVMLRLGYRWDRAGVYVIGGQARFEDGDSGGENVFGAGLNLFGNETTSINFQLKRFGDDGELTTIGVGFQYYFGGFR